MKIKAISTFILAALTLQSCSEQSWTDEELALLHDSAPIMHVLSIDVDGEREVLRMQSTDLTSTALNSPEFDSLARKMIATVTDPSQDGVGIAGPQVGISRRIVAVQRFDKEGEPFEIYPNIRITEKRGEEVSGPEGCLSVPGKRGNVLRSRDITIAYTSPCSMNDTLEVITGFTAVIFQHECDHLDGMVFTDRLPQE